jgi:hypothetical protein
MLKPRNGNESLHETKNDNDVRVVKFATHKNVTVKITLFSHSNIHNRICTPPDEKTQSY